MLSNAELRLTLTAADAARARGADREADRRLPLVTPFLQSVIDAIALGAVYGVVALGIGLVFGVMRLVEPRLRRADHGRRLHARLPERPAGDRRDPRLLRASSIALTLVLERVAFRPLRGASPATMLVATLRDQLPAPERLPARVRLARRSTVGTLGGLNTAIAIGSLRIRWISIVAVVVGAVLLAGTDAAPEPDDDRPAHPRRRGRLPHRAASSASARTA